MRNPTIELPAEDIARFEADGFVLLPGFFDLESEIEPVQRAIYDVVGRVLARHGLLSEREPYSPQTFDSGFRELVRMNRAYGGEVYDAVKQIPAFQRLAVNERVETLYRTLRDSELPGFASGGQGIRIDIPGEERFRATWHQEYPAQLHSVDGIVFWSPLLTISEELGPVRFCRGSHHWGLQRVRRGDASQPEKTGAYGLVLENEEDILSSCPIVAPLSEPGDLIAVDFLTVHSSGFNRSKRARWSMQFRYFNFLDPVGTRIGWTGSYAAGRDFASVHPELVAS